MQYLLLAVAFGSYAYAANKFTLGANFFQKSFKKDKTYTLTRKNVNNTAFVYWIISWARRESLKTSDFSSLICDQAVLRFSHFLWEVWSQVISKFATSNVNKNRFHCLIECHINTIIYKQKRNDIVYLLSYQLGKTAGAVSMHRIWQFRLFVDIYSTLHNYGKSSWQ